MTKKVLVIFSHPKENSLNGTILKNYINYLEEEKIEYNIIKLYQEGFDPVLRESSSSTQKELIKEYQNLILWADNLTFIYPVWWAGFPAILKGFFDRVFESGFAYKYRKGKTIPEKFLTGKTSHVIRTFGGPRAGSILTAGANYFGLWVGLFWFTGIKFLGTYNLFKTNKSSFSQKELDVFLKKIKKSVKRFK